MFEERISRRKKKQKLVHLIVAGIITNFSTSYHQSTEIPCQGRIPNTENNDIGHARICNHVTKSNQKHIQEEIHLLMLKFGLFPM